MNNMFASYLSPHLTLSPHRESQQQQSSDNCSVTTQSTAGSRSSKGSKGSKAKAQDYQLLLSELQKHQAQFQQARSQLASSLLRMGEYHVRHGEYDEAMLALRDSLNENRSVVCSSLNGMPNLDVISTSDESLISGMTESHTAALSTPRGSISVVSSTSSPSTYLASISNNKDKDTTTVSSTTTAQATDPETINAQRQSLNDMITTLSSIGKVHSLRGEDAAAIKYYNEKTKIQSIKNNIEEQLSVGNAGCAGSDFFFGDGLQKGGGSILAEINEDVKALDELFRGITFRKDTPKATAAEAESSNKMQEDEGEDDTRNDQDATGGSTTFDERSGCYSQSTYDDESLMSNSTSMSRKSKKSNSEPHRRRRVRVSINTDMNESIPVLPVIRQARQSSHRRQSTTSTVASHDGSSVATNTTNNKEDNELADAIDSYRTVIDSNGGRNSEKHEKKYAEFLRKYEAIQKQSTTSMSSSDRSSSTSSSSTANSSPTSKLQLSRRKEWTLALDIYESALSAQKEATSRIPFPPGTPRKRTASDFNQDAHTSVASTLIAMGGLYYKLGNVHKELEKYNEALTVYQETLGSDHPHVAGTMKNIGMVLAERGELDEAMAKFQEAQRIYKSINDNRQEGPCCDVASALSCMGNVQNRRGDLDDALRLYEEALCIYKSVSKRARDMGGRSRLAIQEVASTLKIMGMVYTKRGELDMAMNCFQDAIDIMRQNFNEKGSGPVVTSILSRIGGIFAKLGKLEEAMSHYQEAYDLATRTFGTTNHPEVAQILHHIAGIHQKGGDLAEAMRCYKNAAKLYQAALGRNDPTVATTLVCIGSIYYIEKNLDKAMTYYKDALRLNRSVYGYKHPDVIPTMKSIALIHAKKENYDNAIEIFTEVLNIKRAEVGQNHPEVAGAHKRIGNVHYQRGRRDLAEVEYKKALSIYQQTLGPEHHSTKSAEAIVLKVRKEIHASSSEQVSDSVDFSETVSTSTNFFKRLKPKGYESL